MKELETRGLTSLMRDDEVYRRLAGHIDLGGFR
jgi:hypothetical protein